MPRYRLLSQLFGNWATSLEAGLGFEQAIRLSKRTLATATDRAAPEVAMDQLGRGSSFPEALQVASRRWPMFVIPVLQAGERSGRMDEALRFLENHCRLLHGPAGALQRAWLYPLCVLLAGTVFRLLASLWTGSLSETCWLLLLELKSYATLACFVAIMVAPFFRPLVDPLKLLVPFIGAAERELAVNRFFCVLSMVYATGGRRVESMIRLAAATVANVALRDDLLRAGRWIEQGSSLTEAFQQPTCLKSPEQEAIASGELTGTLEKSFDRISKEAGEVLKVRLEAFTQIAVRVTMMALVASMAITILSMAG